jgi:hypothetical protein
MNEVDRLGIGICFVATWVMLVLVFVMLNVNFNSINAKLTKEIIVVERTMGSLDLFQGKKYYIPTTEFPPRDIR